MSWIRSLLVTRAPAAVFLIRLMVGAVFLSEGVQKFMFPTDPDRGVARFVKLGFQLPDLVAAFVATFEITCGLIILAGLLTRLAAIPTVIIMLVAIYTTKIPILHAKGWWDMAHAARTDYAMLLGSLFLVWVGGGRWSIDAWLSGSPTRPREILPLCSNGSCWVVRCSHFTRADGVMLRHGNRDLVGIRLQLRR